MKSVCTYQYCAEVLDVSWKMPGSSLPRRFVLSHAFFSQVQRTWGDAATSTRIAATRHLTKYDTLRRRKYLAGNDAEVPVLHIHRPNKLAPQQLKLAGANSVPNITYVYRQIDIILRLRRIISHHFIPADVSVPILGLDFLCHYGLLLYIMQHRFSRQNFNLHTQHCFYHF